MPLSKRDQAQIERRLIATLTEACETAEVEVVGFCWLTHEVDYDLFPSSLRVIWVFDTQANKDQALPAAGRAHARVDRHCVKRSGRSRQPGIGPCAVRF